MYDTHGGIQITQRHHRGRFYRILPNLFTLLLRENCVSSRMNIQWLLLIACLEASCGITEALSDSEKELTVAVVAGVMGAVILISTLVISFYFRRKDSKKGLRAAPHVYDEKATSF